VDEESSRFTAGSSSGVLTVLCSSLPTRVLNQCPPVPPQDTGGCPPVPQSVCEQAENLASEPPGGEVRGVQGGNGARREEAPAGLC